MRTRSELVVLANTLAMFISTSGAQAQQDGGVNQDASVIPTRSEETVRIPDQRGPAIASLETEGDCPDLATLERAFDEALGPSWKEDVGLRTLRVTDGSRTLRLQILGTDGQPEVDRTIRRSNCDAVARTFAFIAKTHFIELKLVLPDPPPAPKTTAPPATPESEADPSTLETETTEVGSPNEGLLFSAAVAIGGDVTLSPGALALGLGTEVAVSAPTWWAALTIEGRLPQQISEQGERIDWFALREALAAGLRWQATGLSLRAGLRLGATQFFVSPASIEAPEVVLTTTFIGLTVGGTLPVSGPLGVRVQSSFDYLTGQFEYVIEPTGGVATSPSAHWFSAVSLVLFL